MFGGKEEFLSVVMHMFIKNFSPQLLSMCAAILK